MKGSFFILVLLPSLLFSQRQELKGSITNKIEVEGIHVINQSARYNAITDYNGKFAIKAGIQDTLLISSIRYLPKLVIITSEIVNNNTIEVTLEDIVNELDEVKLGNQLTGNLATDISTIKTEKPINFDDVGIPGFKGKPEEKIAPVVPSLGLGTVVDVEALYKHLSGYYKKLKMHRKWESQDFTALAIIDYYKASFFKEAYNIPENKLYDFMLFCLETTTLGQDFKKEKFSLVLTIFKEKSSIYVIRLETNKKQ